MFKKLFLTLVLLLGLANAAENNPLRTLYVSPGGSDGQDGLSNETAFRSIGQAAKNVQAGDLVLVQGGIYREEVVVTASGTAENPIIFRVAPDETALLTWGWDLLEWQKQANSRFIYEATFPYAINVLFERSSLDRYLELLSPALLDIQPGAFYCDREHGKLLLHARDGGDPTDSGIVAVPYYQDGHPAPVNADLSKIDRWSTGVRLSGDYLSFEGFEIAFHPAAGRIMRVGISATFCAFRNNTVYGATNGLKASWRVADAVLENNRVYRVAGAGIQIGSHFKQVLVRNNFLLNNGPCAPFKEQLSATEGHPINLNRYGGDADSTELQFHDNLVISADAARRYGVMRCKGGVAGLELRDNIFIGGTVNIYPVPEKPGKISGNTIVDGTLYIGSSASGKEYQPEITANLILKNSDRTSPRFANAAKHDYRLLPDSPHLGSGARPEPARVIYVNPEVAAGGDGTLPEKPLSSLVAALQRESIDTIYLAPGTYRESLNIGDRKNLRLAADASGEVVFSAQGLTFSGCENLILEDIVLKDATILMQDSGLRFENCVFVAAGLTAAGGKVELINNTFASNTTVKTAGTRAVLRNNLFCTPGQLPVLTAGVSISENNCFSGDSAAESLQAWKKSVNERWPSFTAAVTLDDAYRLPAKSRLRFAGLGYRPIGARAPLPPIPNLSVENLEVAMLLSDRALLRWSTPYEYADVEITCRDTAQQKNLFVKQIKQGPFAVTANTCCLRGLTPGTEYQAQLNFRDRNHSAIEKAVLSFTTTAEEQNQPKTLYVSASSGQNNNNGLTPETAKQTIASALLEARRGDTVLIAAGTYPEMLEINCDGLTLKAEKPGQVRLSAQRVFDVLLQLNQVQEIVIDGLMFTDVYYTASGISLGMTDVSKITVKNCIFDRNRTLGRGACANVQLRGVGVDGLTVSNCIFDSGFHGIWISQGDNLKYFNNTFQGIGINAIHSGCSDDAKVEMFNNIYANVVSNHHSPAISVGAHGPGIYSDYNLYWHTSKVCPQQKIYAFGGGGGRSSAPWTVLQKDMSETLEETRSRYGIDAHSIFADPLFSASEKSDFSLQDGSPAIAAGRAGQNIGADLTVFTHNAQK